MSENNQSSYDENSIVDDLNEENPITDNSINIEVDEEKVRPWEIWHLQSDNTKLYDVITSRPTVSLDEALKRTIDYYHKNGGWDW